MNTELNNYWFVICKASEITQHLKSLKLQGIPLVMFRDKTGNCQAFIDRCPHRGVPLSLGKLQDDQITCAYHGWRFNSAGQCIEIPALQQPHSVCLQRVRLHEKHGFIFATLSSEPNERLPLDPPVGYYQFYWHQIITGDLIDLVENFLDATHTPYVHNGLIRSGKMPQLIEAELERNADQIKIIYKGEKQQQGLISRLFESERSYSEAIFMMPSVAEINYYDANGLKLKIRICLTAITDHEFSAHIFFNLRRKFSSRLQYWLGYPLFYWALKQDLKILTAQFNNKRLFTNKPYVVNPQIDLIRPDLQDLMSNRNFTVTHRKITKLWV